MGGMGKKRSPRKLRVTRETMKDLGKSRLGGAVGAGTRADTDPAGACAPTKGCATNELQCTRYCTVDTCQFCTVGCATQYQATCLGC